MLGLIFQRSVLADHDTSPVVELGALLEDAELCELLALDMALAEQLLHANCSVTDFLRVTCLATQFAIIIIIFVRSVYALFDSGHAEAAACLDLPYIADDDGASPVKRGARRPPRDGAHQLLESGTVPLDDGGPAKETEDARGGAEAHEHEAQAAILVAVGDGLAARAHAVNVRAAVGRENGKVRVGEALGRHIDVRTVGGSRAREEDGLLTDPAGQFVGEGVVELHP